MKLQALILFFITNSIFSQITDFSGKILDQKTKEPIAFAHINFKDSNGVGVSSTLTGEFSMVIEDHYLESEVRISCLGYKATTASASDLQNKSYFLEPKSELLQEVIVGKSESKEVLIGSTKGKRERLSGKRDLRMIAQFIKNPKENESCDYIKEVTFTFKESYRHPANARIRIFDKDELTGTPKNDLLDKSILITINKKTKEYNLNLYDYDVEVPEEGFFVVIEKLIIPLNRWFIAPIELSTYPRYVRNFKKNKIKHDSLNLELLSFEKYRDEVTGYAPGVDITENSRTPESYGNLYILREDTWTNYNRFGTQFIMPLEVTLSN